jgi:HSP20 family molecular chaperone IbpA
MATQNKAATAAEGSAAGARSNNPLARSGAAEAVLRPPVDIHETADEIVLRADMPGVDRERLAVRVDGNNLLVEGSIGIAPQDSMTALYADVRATMYRRQFVLSNELDSGSIAASLQNGVLTLRLPKRAEHKPRRIPVG